MNLIERRRALLGQAASGPLYAFPNGSYHAMNGVDRPLSQYDVVISNGNEVQFYKRWGDYAGDYTGLLSNWDPAPFSLFAGDTVRTVITKNSGTTGSGIRITAGTSRNDYSNPLISMNLETNDTAEATVTISKDMETPLFVVRPNANTMQRQFNFTVEIYVNGVRYI